MGNPIQFGPLRPGRYAMVQGKPKTFEALCAYDGCGHEIQVGPCSCVEVPKRLREHGWGMTGKTMAARWWCPKHGPAVGAK